MNTPHLYKGATSSAEKPEEVGYPLHLLTEEGGYVLEEPPQLTDMFKHYWYISKSMLTCCAYKEEGPSGNHIRIPKNSDAARLMYYVLVVKNGAGAEAPDVNVTDLDTEKFTDNFTDKNNSDIWRFPESTFKEVSKLLADKLADVQDKSFNCEHLTIQITPFDVFRKTLSSKGPLGALITLEIDLHLPLTNDRVDATDAHHSTSKKRGVGASIKTDDFKE